MNFKFFFILHCISVYSALHFKDSEKSLFQSGGVVNEIPLFIV